MLYFIALPFQIITLGLYFTRGAQADCYYPDGSNATDFEYVPCKSGSGFSSCCIPSEGDVCLSNGLCYYDYGPYPFRGACTDSTYNDKSCVQWCRSSSVDTYEALTSCGGTKWCCSSNSGCCSKPNLVFDIGVPSVVNNYGSAKTWSTLPTANPTTGGPRTVQTAAVTGNDKATIATDAFATGTATSTSTPNKAAAASSSRKGLIIGIVAAVIVFFFLAIVAGIVVFCLMRRKGNKAKAAAPVNLIDMHAPSAPQQVYTGSTAQLVQPPSQHGQYAPEKATYEPAPAYTPPHYQQPPVGPHGQTMYELQSPPSKPVGPNGQVYHELG